MKKIESLTTEQKAQISNWVKKWIDIGLKTGEADWATFDKYFPVCYGKAGLAYPKNIVRVDSPLVGALAASIADVVINNLAVSGAVKRT